MNSPNQPHHAAPHEAGQAFNIYQRQIQTTILNEIHVNEQLLGPDGLTHSVIVKDENGKDKEIQGDVEYLISMATSLKPVPAEEYDEERRKHPDPKNPVMYPDIDPKELPGLTTSLAFARQYPELYTVAVALRSAGGDKGVALQLLNNQAAQVAPKANLWEIYDFKRLEFQDRQKAYQWFVQRERPRQLERQQKQQAQQTTGEQGRQAARTPSRLKRVGRAMRAAIRSQFENPYTTILPNPDKPDEEHR